MKKKVAVITEVQVVYACDFTAQVHKNRHKKATASD